MAGEGVDTAVANVLAQVACADRRFAEDLILALRSYISAERRLIAIDDVVGHAVAERAERLSRLELALARLELELGI